MSDFYLFPGNLDPTAPAFFPANFHHFAPPQSNHYALAPAPALAPAISVAVPLPRVSSNPSRTLLLSMVPPDVSETIIRRELEVFGDVRAVQMERLRRAGVVTVHFYDLRQAEAAAAAIQGQHMQQQHRLRMHHEAVLMSNNGGYSFFIPPPPAPPHAVGLIAGQAVWAQFTSPDISSIPDGANQGTLALFNLKPGVTLPMLHQIFQQFGYVREIRESPKTATRKFVEFFDVREAARALTEMNDVNIHGQTIRVHFSRPGSSRRYHPEPNQSPRSSHTLGMIPAGLPPPMIRQNSGRWVANPDYFSDRQASSNNSVGRSSRFSRSSSNSSGGSPSPANSMASLSLSRGVAPRLRKKNRSPTTATTSSATSSSGGSSSKTHYRRRSTASSFKGSSSSSRQTLDPRFLINDEAIEALDSRTTVMIKNIPNKYSQQLLLNMLDSHCLHCNEQDDTQTLSSYDFVYLPIDFQNKCNVGYGFVNMTSPEATMRLYKAFHLQSWEAFNSRKICEITYARLQGLEALKEHFRSSKFPAEVEEYMPVEFSPPRDGRRLAEPVVVAGRKRAVKKCLSSSSSEGNGKGSGAVINDEDEVVVYRGGASGGAWQA